MNDSVALRWSNGSVAGAGAALNRTGRLTGRGPSESL